MINKKKKTNISLFPDPSVDDKDKDFLYGLEDILKQHLVVKKGDRVWIKPNLVLPFYVKGVCTSRHVIEGLIRILTDKGCKVCICEGDGGLASFSAYDSFAGNKLLDLKEKYNVKFISLSQLPRKSITQIVDKREIRFNLPEALIYKEYDAFINIPVLKVHIITKLSLSMKNLWGCIPDPFRIHYHHFLNYGIVALWKTIQPELSIIDGIYALDDNGPLNGTPIRMNLLIFGSGDASLDRIGAKILGVPFESVKHLKIAEKENLIQSKDLIQLNRPVNDFCKHVFSAKRKFVDWPGILIGRSPALQGIVYHSRATKTIYKLFRKMRTKSAINNMPRFGEPGWGKGCGKSEFCKLSIEKEKN